MIRSRRVKSQSLGMSLWYIPAYLKKTQTSKLGDAQGIPFFINKVSGHLQCNYILIQSHLKCFTWSICVFLFLFSYLLNKLDPTILVWERDTLLFFMWILVFFTYICWVFLFGYYKLPALVFHTSLVRDVSSFMLDCTLFFIVELFRECLCSNKLIGVWLEIENASCGRWYMERHTHACRSLSWIIWCLAIVLSSQVDHV